MSRVRRYQNSELYERLAAEYVLGTLHGRALARFKKLLEERPYIQYSVDIWEKRFNSLGELQLVNSNMEIRPSAGVWEKIIAEVQTKQENSPGIFAQDHTKPAGLFARLGFWQAATVLSSLLLIFTVFMPMQKLMKSPAQQLGIIGAAPTFVAILESHENKPMMVTTGLQQQGLIQVRMGTMPDIPKSEDWMLWAIPKGGADPVPVGILQRDAMQTDLKITRKQWKENLQGIEMFGVTSEPRNAENGTPVLRIGGPSNPILYKGKCLEFT